MPNESDTKVLATVSPSLHPDALTPWAGPLTENDKPLPALTAGRAALRALYEGMGDLENAVTTTQARFADHMVVSGPNIVPALPDEAATQLAADMGTRFASVARTFDQQFSAVGETIENLESLIAKVLTNTKRDAMAAIEASDIRRYVKDQEKPLNFLHGAIDAGDHEVVSAVLATTPWVSGLNRDNYQLVKELAAMRFAPKEFAALTAAKSLRDHLTNASKIFVERYRKITPVPSASNPHVAAIKKLKGEV